jgi:serine-type D-Ala-D-Ala carboxypeptidase/endopeptidase (penicillin-binding protein 4)
MHIRSILCLFFLLSFVGGSAKQPPQQSDMLTPSFETFRNNASLKHASWSVIATDLVSNTTLLDHNSQLALCPASAQKLLTTATALLILGADYTFSTSLAYDGWIDDTGVLHGNMYIIGSGDPSLGSSAMDDSLSTSRVLTHFITKVRAAGIRQIRGNLIADDTHFDHEMIPGKWLWEDIGNYFGAGSSGLSINENEFTAYFTAGQVLGAPAALDRTEPHLPDTRMLNQVTTGPRGSGDQVYIFGAPYVQERLLTGTVPLGARGFAVRGSLPDPPAFLATAFEAHLAKSGIAVLGNVITSREVSKLPVVEEVKRIEIGRWQSPPLSDIIKRTNIFSVNMYAENLLKKIGFEVSGTGSTKAGIDAMITFWENRGMDTGGMKLIDGSGLSPVNRMTTSQMAFLLASMSRENMFDIFINSLPLAGYTGSIANQFGGTKSAGVLRAKSGFLSGARSYAGYTRRQNGHPVAFVIIVNDYDGTPAAMRTRMLNLLDAITSSP